MLAPLAAQARAGIRSWRPDGKRTMEKKGVGRPRDGNPEETRRQILEAAASAFAESGFVGATTRTVAARAGVNVASRSKSAMPSEGESSSGSAPMVASARQWRHARLHERVISQ